MKRNQGEEIVSAIQINVNEFVKVSVLKYLVFSNTESQMLSEIKENIAIENRCLQPISK